MMERANELLRLFSDLHWYHPPHIHTYRHTYIHIGIHTYIHKKTNKKNVTKIKAWTSSFYGTKLNPNSLSLSCADSLVPGRRRMVVPSLVTPQIDWLGESALVSPRVRTFMNLLSWVAGLSSLLNSEGENPCKINRCSPLCTIFYTGTWFGKLGQRREGK